MYQCFTSSTSKNEMAQRRFFLLLSSLSQTYSSSYLRSFINKQKDHFTVSWLHLSIKSFQPIREHLRCQPGLLIESVTYVYSRLKWSHFSDYKWLDLNRSRCICAKSNCNSFLRSFYTCYRLGRHSVVWSKFEEQPNNCWALTSVFEVCKTMWTNEVVDHHLLAQIFCLCNQHHIIDYCISARHFIHPQIQCS